MPGVEQLTSQRRKRRRRREGRRRREEGGEEGKNTQKGGVRSIDARLSKATETERERESRG